MDEKMGNVKVVCRFRPLNEREKALGNLTVHDLLDDKTVAIKDSKLEKVDKNGQPETLKFSFDRVFGMESTQEQVYTYAASSLIDSVIEGFNGTIFAYGQTSSGKTHTMEGIIEKDIGQEAGIIPRMVKQVFESISKCTENVEFRIKVSMVQLYMEKLRDLIDTNKSDMKIRSDKKRGIFIENLTETYISSPEEVYDLMKIARGTRAIAATNMNERSSRSHMLFILTISQNNLDDLSAKTGKLYLVDLAGSEKVGKTGAEGKVLDEAKKINISLTALSKVISDLTDGKSKHVNYRDSKLTRVLQESLGGNSKTSLIVTCSPHPNNISETLSTLRFGVSAKKIKNKPKINKEMTVAELQNLLEKTEKELAERQKYIKQLKDYITIDLSQKSVPQFSNGDKAQIVEHQETDLVGELEKQLEIQRNLNIVQEQQLTNLKEKFDKIQLDKQNLEIQLANERKKKKKEKDISPHKPIRDEDDEIEGRSQISMGQLIKELEEIADEKVISYLQSRTQSEISVEPLGEYNELLENYETEKQKRVEAEDKMVRYEKVMQKKLNQLENNICQLTHAYYDLLIIQQRHKVDNIFLKRKLEDKDISILSLKDKIRDLQDQNRDLEDQRWADEEEVRERERKPLSKYSISEAQQNKLDAFMQEKKGSAVPSSCNPKVVKVVRGGNK